MTARFVTQLTSQWVLQEQGTPWASNIYSDPKQWSCWSMEGEVMYMFSEDKLKKKKKSEVKRLNHMVKFFSREVVTQAKT